MGCKEACLIICSNVYSLYPQVVFGVFLLSVGTALKLYSAWVGLLVLVLALPVLVCIVLLLHFKLRNGLPGAVGSLIKGTVLIRFSLSCILANHSPRPTRSWTFCTGQSDSAFLGGCGRVCAAGVGAAQRHARR
jgi:hypothetical protein